MLVILELKCESNFCLGEGKVFKIFFLTKSYDGLLCVWL